MYDDVIDVVVRFDNVDGNVARADVIVVIVYVALVIATVDGNRVVYDDVCGVVYVIVVA